MTFRRFEEISAWQTARSLRAKVCSVTQGRKFSEDYDLKHQLRRAALSAMANIAEGFSHRSDKHFARYLIAARALTNEVQSHLYAALDEGRIADAQFRELYSLAEVCAKQLASLISYLVRSHEENLPTALTRDEKTTGPSTRGSTLNKEDQVDPPDILRG